MNFIVFDLEATCWQNRPPQTQEIIEIGALKFNEYSEYVDYFSRFVKPVIHPNLSPFCTELTTIQQKDVDRADKFPKVIEDFQDWVEIFDEDYLLCAWGDFDRKMLIKDCELHNMEPEWAESFIDLKAQYREIRRLRHPIGLKKALQLEGFGFTGTPHRGIDDAENTGKIFQKFFDEWRY